MVPKSKNRTELEENERKQIVWVWHLKYNGSARHRRNNK